MPLPQDLPNMLLPMARNRPVRHAINSVTLPRVAPHLFLNPPARWKLAHRPFRLALRSRRLPRPRPRTMMHVMHALHEWHFHEHIYLTVVVVIFIFYMSSIAQSHRIVQWYARCCAKLSPHAPLSA